MKSDLTYFFGMKALQTHSTHSFTLLFDSIQKTRSYSSAQFFYSTLYFSENMRRVFKLDQYIKTKRPVFYMDCATLYKFWVMLTIYLNWISVLSTHTNFKVMSYVWIASNKYLFLEVCLLIGTRLVQRLLIGTRFLIGTKEYIAAPATRNWP